MDRAATARNTRTPARAPAVATHDPGKIGHPPKINGGLVNRVVVGLLLLPAAPLFLARALGWDSIARVFTTMVTLVAAAAVTRYALAWYLWARRAATHAAWEVICAVTKDHKTAAERRARFRVRRRKYGPAGITPLVVRVRPGTGFDPGDTKAMQRLAARWAQHTQAHHGVTATAGNNGWIKLAPAPEPDAHPGVVETALDTIGRRVPNRAAPTRATVTPVVARATSDPDPEAEIVDDLTRALGTVLGAGTSVKITGTWDDDSPRVMVIAYQPESAPQADQARSEIARLLSELHPAKGAWVIEWKAAEKTFTAADIIHRAEQQPADGLPDDQADPEQAARRAATNDLEAALRPAFSDTSTLEVARWSDNTPVDFYLRYPPRDTKRALKSKVSLLEVLEVPYPPGDKNLWRIDLEGQDRRFHFQLVEDVLAQPVPLPPIPALADIDLRRVPLAMFEDGPMTISVLGDQGTTNYLCVGASGSGKSCPQWGVLRYLAPLIHAGMVKPYLVDSKSQEFGRCAQFAQGRVAVSADDIAQLILDAMGEIDAQARRLDAAGHTKMTPEVISPEFPLILVILDEILSLTSRGFFAADQYPKVMTAIARMLSTGRSVGAFVLANSQDPRVSTLPFRCLFLNTVALRLSSDGDVATVFDNSARNQGALCDKIPETRPGTGYLATDGRAGYRRLRFPFVDDAERIRFLARYTPGTPEPVAPQITPVPAGEQMTITQVEPAVAQPAPRRRRSWTVSPKKLEKGDRFTFPDSLVLVATVVNVDVVLDEDGQETSRVMVEYRLPASAETEMIELDDDVDTVNRLP